MAMDPRRIKDKLLQQERAHESQLQDVQQQMRRLQEEKNLQLAHTTELAHLTQKIQELVATRPQLSADCVCLTAGALVWWVASFGLVSHVTVDTFTAAYVETMKKRHDLLQLHQTFAVALTALIGASLFDQFDKEYFQRGAVRATAFRDFLLSWGPFELSLQKVLPMLTFDGGLQPWFVTSASNKAAILGQYRFATWLVYPGKFHTQRADESLPFTILNDVQNTRAATACSYGYYVPNSADRVPYPTLVDVLAPFVGYDPPVAADPRSTRFSCCSPAELNDVSVGKRPELTRHYKPTSFLSRAGTVLSVALVIGLQLETRFLLDF